MIEIQPNTKWTQEALDMLLTCLGLEPPMSYRETAEQMTKHFGILYTKNACIGMGRRLRVPPRPLPVKKKRDGRFLVRTDAPILPPEAWHPDDGNKLTIYQLHQGDCHWPLGEVEDYPPYSVLRQAGRRRHVLLSRALRPRLQ